MDDRLDAVFSYFEGENVAVTGSAVRDIETAHDIDVLVPNTVDLPALAQKHGASYNGWDTPDGLHIRRANLRVPGLRRPVQLIQRRDVSSFEQWPHAVLLRDGRVLNEGKFYDKPKPKAQRRPLR